MNLRPSPYISIKSIDMNKYPTFIRTSSKTPTEYLKERITNFKAMFVDFNSPIQSFSRRDKGIGHY